MAKKYYWWEKDQSGPGNNPFLSGGGGIENPFLSGGGADPYQKSMTSAQQDSQNITAKEQSLGMAPMQEPSMWSKAGTGALGFLHWATTPLRKATNSLAGGLEEARNYNHAGTPYSLGSEMGAIGSGLAKGWNEDKQYSLGRYIGNLTSDMTGQERGQGIAPIRLAEAIFTDHNEQAGQSAWEFAHRQYGPSPEGTGLGTRLADSTISDILGFYTEGKAMDRLTPLRLGRTVVPGQTGAVVDDFATNLAKDAASAATSAPRKFTIVNKGQNMLDEIMGAAKKAPLDNLPGVNNINQARRLVQSEFGISANEAGKLGDKALFGMAQDIVGSRPLMDPVTRVTQEAGKRGFSSLDELFNTASKSPMEQFQSAASKAKWRSVYEGLPDIGLQRPGSIPAKVDPIMKAADDQLRRVMEVFIPGKGWVAPAMETQLKYGDKLAAGGRAALGMLPQGAQDVLGTVFRNMETSGTPHVRAMNEAIDVTKQGARTGISNTEERLFKALDTLAPNITDNERRALYYAIGMGKNLDDPEFLASLTKSFDIPATELQGLTRLQGFKDFVTNEFQGFKTRGEAKGLFKGIEDPYVPIFRNGLGSQGEMGTNQAMRQQMGGLRSIQKLRTIDPEQLLDRSGQLAQGTDDIVNAMMRYNRTFHNIERTANLTDSLKKIGIVSTENKAGYDTLADAISFGSTGKDTQRLYIDKTYKGRLANEMLGILRDSPVGQGLKKIEDFTRPWKTLVTTLNPAYHIRNTIDDFTRTNLLGEGNLGDYAKAVTRETGATAFKGVRIKDWAKNAAGQWEYTPGIDHALDLTVSDAKGLARAMGASRTQTQAMGASMPLSKKAAKFATDKTGLDIFKDPGQVSREAYFLSGLRKHGNADIAKQIVNNDLINYGDISPLMRDVVRPLAPFSTFATKNPAVALESSLRNPGRLAQFDMLRNKTAQGDQSLYSNLPEYLRDQGVLSWRDGKGNVQVLNPGLAQFDWQNMASPMGKGMKVLSRMPHPVIQAILGLQRGVDSNGIPIDTAEGYGKKPVSNLASMLLPTEQGPDGGQYASAQNKFLFDSLLSGPQAMSTAFSDPSSFLTKGINKQFSEQDLILKALLEMNRNRQGRLKGFEQMGGQVPLMKDLRQHSNNPFLSQ